MTHRLRPYLIASIKPILFLLCLAPLGLLILDVWQNRLGPNPAEVIIAALGEWTLRFLLLTLTITPLRLLFKQPSLLRYRRMLGLFTFFYALLHFSAWFVFDHNLAVDMLVEDIIDRPFITVGFLAFVGLFVLALTSNRWAIKKMGGKRWQFVHRAVYLIAFLACVHFLWLVKQVALLEPMVYTGIFVLLMLPRLYRWHHSYQAKTHTAR